MCAVNVIFFLFNYYFFWCCKCVSYKNLSALCYNICDWFKLPPTILFIKHMEALVLQNKASSKASSIFLHYSFSYIMDVCSLWRFVRVQLTAYSLHLSTIKLFNKGFCFCTTFTVLPFIKFMERACDSIVSNPTIFWMSGICCLSLFHSQLFTWSFSKKLRIHWTSIFVFSISIKVPGTIFCLNRCLSLSLTDKILFFTFCKTWTPLPFPLHDWRQESIQYTCYPMIYLFQKAI